MDGRSGHAELTRHLADVRNRLLRRTVARGLLLVAATIALASAVAVLLQGVFGPRLDLGIALAVVLMGILGWALTKGVLLPLHRFPSLRRLAMRIDDLIPGDEDHTINALDLGARRDATEDPISRGLIDSVIATSLPRIGSVRTALLDNGPRAKPLLGSIAVALLVLVAFELIAPMRHRAAWLALLNPTRFPYAPTVTIDVTPGDVDIDSGQGLAVTAVIEGTDASGRLLYRKQGGTWKNLQMSVVSEEQVTWEGRLDGSQVTVEQRIPKRTVELALSDIRRDTEYRVVAGDRESDVYTVHVLTPPRVAGYETTVAFPPYTGVAPETARAASGAVSALRGSDVTVTLLTEGDVGRASVEWSDGAQVDLRRSDAGAWSIPFVASEPTEYRVRLSDEDGRVRFESPFFPVNVLDDRDPVVQVTNPATNIDVPEDLELPVAVTCADDYGLDRLLLHIRKEPHDPFQQQVASFKTGVRDSTVEFVWELESLDLIPGDVVTYYFELFDNDVVSGPKATRSMVYEIRFPSMAELYERSEKDYADNVVDAVEKLADQERDLRERLRTARQEIERSREGVTWERQKEIESLVERHEDFRQELSQALSALERSVDRMAENNMADYQVLERMEAIQSLLEEIDDERLQGMMELVQKALADMDPEELQRALETFELTQNEILQQLDRAAEHLKQVLAEKKLDNLIDSVQALEEEQAKVNDQLEGKKPSDSADETKDGQSTDDASPADAEESTTDPNQDSNADMENAESAETDDAASEQETASNPESGEDESATKPSDDQSGAEESENADSEASPPELTPEEMAALAERQEALKEQLEKLQEQLEQVQQEAQESHQRLSEAMEQQDSKSAMSEAQKAMEEASESMQQQQQDVARRYGFEAEEQLQSLGNMLQAASSQMQQDLAQQLSEELLALGADLLHLSGREERVVKVPDGTTTRDIAAQQMRLYDVAGRATEKLHEISRETMMVSQGLIRNMGAVLEDMSQATDQFEAGNRTRADREAQSAMSGLNRAVMELLETGQQMNMQGGSCTNPNPNMMNRIPSLTGMQQQLNQETQQLSRQMGRRLSPATGQQALKQLAARQEAIRQGVQEVANELGSRRDVLGRIDSMGAELEDIVEQMKQGKLDRTLIKRQEQILSRLLAAERSVRQQDEDDRRVSKTGESADRTSPAELDEDDVGRPDQLELNMMQGRTDPFPARYRSMIESYFKALGREDAR